MAVPNPSVAQTSASGLAQAEIAVDQRIHHAVLEPDLMVSTPVPVDLRVQVVAIQPLRTAVKEVVDVSRKIRVWHERQQLRHRGIEARSGNHVESPIARKHRSPA